MSGRLPDLKGLSREEKLALVARLAREKENKPRFAPLSYAQQRLWFLDRLDPGSHVHTIFRAWRLKGHLDTACLTTAVNRIVARHQSLRTTFTEKDGEALQRVAPNLTIPLPVEDLSELVRSQRREMVTQKARDAARHAFNLVEGPLIRLNLLRLDDQEHALFLAMHHIVADGWSLGIFFKELAFFYEQETGKTETLPALTIQYPDFSYWQREKLDLDAQLAFWKQTLKDVDPILELPCDFMRPAMASQRGAIFPFQWDEDLAVAAEALGRKSGATLFMTLLAIFEVLVYRHTWREDFVVGTPVANRNRAELENMIGSFANTLALRAQIQGRMTFNQLLCQVRDHCLAAFDHQDLPFERLVEALEPERDMSRNPLFQVMFAMLNSGMSAGMTLGNLKAESLPIGRGLSKVDLTLELVRRKDGVSGYFEYALDLFEESTIRRMAYHFHSLLEAVLANPDEMLFQLPMLPQAEKAQLLAGESCAPHESDLPYHRLFEAQVARTPNNTAIIDQHNTRLTYAELNAAANRFARRLRALGVVNETRVGVCAERSPATLAAMLGVLKAGGAYVPLDPDYPQERLAFIARDASIEVLVAREELANGIPHHKDSFISLDGDWQGRSEDEENPDYGVSQHQAAYLIYTSGSTGTPKGVVIPHRSMKAHGAAMIEHYALTPADGVLQFAALSFDISVEEIYPSFLAGARVVLRPSGQVLSFAEFDAYVRQHQITVANIPTPWWHEWVSDLAEGGALPSCLRLIIVGTEAALAERLNLWLETLRHRERQDLRWMNAYGPSETTVTATFWETDSSEPIQRVLIGKSIAAASAYVLDPHFTLAPTGTFGELCIGGEALARGYLDRPALTAEKFKPDPFSKQPGARLYATGDLARFQGDGQIQFLGRSDDQVKIRGFRVETGEIEAVLQNHSRVKEVLVIAIEVAPGDRRLAAYVVPEKDMDPGDLSDYLTQRLPLYMVPAAFVLLEHLPMTPAGKVDRKALPEPTWSGEQSSGTPDQPRSPQEEVLLGIWCDILGLDQIGLHQNFFQLGGHSLLATRVLARMKRLLGVNLPLRALFEAPTIAGLAQWTEKARLEELGLQLPPIKPIPSGMAAPVSFAQQRLWFLDQLEPGSAAYNMPAVWELEGPLNTRALSEALAEMIRRHQSLRTLFQTQRGQPVQVPKEPQNVLAFQDLSQTANPEEEASRLANEASLAVFNLSEGPLFRVTLLKLDSNRHRLVLIMHHIISDGWSIDVALKELLTLHQAFTQNLPSPLEPLPIQVPDYAQWQRDWLSGQTLETQLQYWKDHLKDAPELLELPTDKPRPGVQTSPGARFPLHLPEALTHQLRELSRAEGTTLFMTLLAAFAALLHRYTGQQDILVGSPVAGRRTTELEGLIGLFVNTLVFRINFAEEPGFAQLLKRTRETALGAYSHQDLPFEQLVDGVGVARNLSHNPLFQVFFVLHHAPAMAAASQDLRVRTVPIDNHTSRFDITLSMVERAQTMDGFLEYNTDLFSETTMARMANHFVNLLQAALNQPEHAVANLLLFGGDEKKLMLETWNATQQDLPEEQSADHLFRARVQQNPKAPALVSGSIEMTYNSLDQRVDAMAAELQAMGVTRGDLVGIALGRGPELVISLLAVWRAGGAYVPMDPAYPADRLTWMLEDSGLSVLITTRQLAQDLPFLKATGQQTLSLLYVDKTPTAPGGRPEPLQVYGEQLAYIIYTSGSTGRPKGVQISHGCLVNFLESMAQEPGLTQEDRLVSVTTISFDIAGLELFLPLTRGALLVLAEEESVGDAGKLAQTLETHSATIMQATPATWRLLLDGGWKGRKGLKMLCGGEALDPDLAIRLISCGAQLWNMYGPTETTIWSAVQQVTSQGMEQQGVTLGRPAYNTTIHVVDKRDELAPIGVAGELLIGGSGLSRGYRNRPDLTAEKFVPNPFGSPGSRLYRTGDLTARLADGDLRFLGRLDHQVKIRGYRIEPGEIETALTRHPRVSQSVAVARTMGKDDVRLVVYVLSKAGEGKPLASLADVRNFLQDAIPQYMQPAAAVFMDAFPHTPNGKVDRKALPEPGKGRDLDTQFVAPSNDAEKQLVQIWADVLSKDPIGIHDNFFELGGHSLLATQVMARIAERFDLDIPLRALFEKPTIADLAQVIMNQDVGDADQELLARLLAEMDE